LSTSITDARTWTTTLAMDGGDSLVFHRCAVSAVAGPDRGKQWSIEAPAIRIGLAHGCEVRLSDRTVSRCHAIVSLRGDRYVIRDDESTNGTFVEGVRIVEAFLAPGMKVRMGDTTLVFRTDHRVVEVGEGQDERFGALAGRTPSMRRVFVVLERIAPTPLTCLIAGATGTGKEVAARAIHERSGRRGPFVVVDCASLHPELVESELFGHERGAFTGADRAHAGAFERADSGTVFLDEVGELPLGLQPQLLRVIERREVKRVGATESRDLDVRIVAATHRDLPAMCADGTFRDDLFYRLGEMIVTLPPLRDRAADVPLLARELLAELGSFELAADAVEHLVSRPWPGNVRELRNTLRRAAALVSESGRRRIDRDLLAELELEAAPAHGSVVDGVALEEHLAIADARRAWAATLERAYLARVLQSCAFDLDRVAAHIGLGRKQLLRLLRQHHLDDDHGAPI
jgi:DNA-binding NtrC family response regulator